MWQGRCARERRLPSCSETVAIDVESSIPGCRFREFVWCGARSVDRARLNCAAHSVSHVPNSVEADHPVLRPSRRLVLVADGEHVEASTQRASFIPTWRDTSENEDILDALLQDLEGDPQRAQSGWAEVEQDFGELNHFDMTVPDSDPDPSAPPILPPAGNPRNGGSGSMTPLASPRRDLLGESDTESLSDGASTVSVDGVVVELSEPEVAVPEIRVTSQAIRDAFVGLDAVDLSVVFSKEQL